MEFNFEFLIESLTFKLEDDKGLGYYNVRRNIMTILLDF